MDGVQIRRPIQVILLRCLLPIGPTMRSTTVLACTLVAFVTGVASKSLDVISTSSSGAFAFNLGNGTYYSPASVVSKSCTSSHGKTELLPLTVVKVNETTITAETLVELFKAYVSVDDVWSTAFLNGALAILAPDGAVLSASASSWLASSGIQYLLPSPSLNIHSLTSSEVPVFANAAWAALRPGPYTIYLGASGITIREAYLLHRDNYEAFLFGATPVYGSTSYEAVDLFIPPYQDVWIPVPSKLYSLEDTRPLAGKRVAIKDIYDVEGVQTGGGSRTYAEVMPMANATAIAAQKLLNMGAVIVVRI